MFRVNSLGPFLGMRTLAGPMERAGDGSLVNVASVAAFRVLVKDVAYAGSKGSLRIVSQIAAKALAPLNIRVNAIFPGPLDTPMISPDVRDMMAEVMRTVPAGRLGTPEEIARAALFLASDESSYVQGARSRRRWTPTGSSTSWSTTPG